MSPSTKFTVEPFANACSLHAASTSRSTLLASAAGAAGTARACVLELAGVEVEGSGVGTPETTVSNSSGEELERKDLKSRFVLATGASVVRTTCN
jgi:hypothetical protein